MNIVIYDNSKGKSYRKTRRVFGGLLVQINNRCYIGSLPARTIKELLYNLSKKVSKLSDITIFVQQLDGFHGWAGYHFGRPISKINYEKFLKTNKYIKDG